MKHTFIFLLILLSAISLIGRTHETSQKSFLQFAEGRLENVSLHSDGYLLSAPALDEVASIDAPILWDAEVDSKGNLYVGTGNEGTIYKVSPEGEVSELFTPNRLMSRALAIDSKDNVYVAVSPEGALYRINKDGEVSVFIELPCEYVWDMVFGENDLLYLATGNDGIVYQLDVRDKEPELVEYFDAEEAHITSLAFNPAGGIYAGSATHGLLYKVDESGNGSVAYSTGEREIRKIVVQPDGSVFFSSFNQPSKASSVGSSKKGKGKSGQNQNTNGASFYTEDNKPSGENDSNDGVYSMTITAKSSNESILYYMDVDGFVTNWWLYTDVSIYSLFVQPDGEVLIGSGSDGYVFSAKQPGNWMLMHELKSGGEVTDILPAGEEGKYYLVCSNPGRILLLDTHSSNEGFYESDIVDLDQPSNFGSLQVFNESGDKESLSVEVRAGNVETPDRTWCEWTELFGEGGVFRNSLSPARFLQYRLLFGEASVSPVHQVRFFSKTQNLAPAITDIRILELGYEAITFKAQNSLPNVDLARSLNQGIEAQFERLANKPVQVKVFAKPGAQTLAWNAIDGNGDELSSKVLLSELGSDNWITLGDDLEAKYFTFNTKGFSDGYYRIKIIVDDKRSNPVVDAKSTEQISELFLIDNTPPVVELLDYVRSGDSVTVKLKVSDGTSLIGSANYRINGNDRDFMHPEDGILDEKVEEFTLHLTTPVGDGETLLIEIEDEVGNLKAFAHSLE